jgi:phospholipase C
MHHRFLFALLVVGACSSSPDATQTPLGTGDTDASAIDVDATAIAPPPDATPTAAIDHVVIVIMENHDWSQIAGNPSAPYINSLLPIFAHAEAYSNPPGLHPSEPNYIWLEAGSNLGVTTDADPASNQVSTTAHLTDLLDAANVSWKAYEEDAPSGCPVASAGFYAAKHDPFVFFTDVTDSSRCTAHVRPMTDLAADLAGGALPRYAFVTPNLCDDMHGASGCPSGDLVAAGDAWLATTVPQIMASPTYQAGHTVILLTWDESASATAPIGMIAISPDAKPGYANTIPYSHSSTLRTLEEVFGVGPMLADAANATDLSDLFTRFP